MLWYGLNQGVSILVLPGTALFKLSLYLTVLVQFMKLSSLDHSLSTVHEALISRSCVVSALITGINNSLQYIQIDFYIVIIFYYIFTVRLNLFDQK